MQRQSIAILSALVIATSASLAHAQTSEEQADAPISDEARRRDDRHALGETLWVAGLSVFAATWALTGAAGTTLVNVANGRTETIVESWIPLVGPWIMLGDSRGFDGLQLALTAVSGVLQAVGCGALIAGLVLVNESPDDASSASVWLVPTAGDQGGGLAVAGSF